MAEAMATANTRRTWLRILLGGGVILVAGAVFFREPLIGQGRTGAAFGARTACSCRYVAGRTLADCKKDFEPGMWAVFLTDDEDARSVTARVPLIATETARFRRGYGCVLDPWSG